MKKLYIYFIFISSILILNNCGTIKEFKSLNLDEIFRVYATSYREVSIFNEETKKIDKTWGINVKPLNDSIVILNNINIENAELKILYKNKEFKTKNVVSKKGNYYLQFYLLSLENENINLKDSLNLSNFNTWANKFDLIMKIEVNGVIRNLKYVSE